MPPKVRFKKSRPRVEQNLNARGGAETVPAPSSAAGGGGPTPAPPAEEAPPSHPQRVVSADGARIRETARSRFEEALKRPPKGDGVKGEGEGGAAGGLDPKDAVRIAVLLEQRLFEHHFNEADNEAYRRQLAVMRGRLSRCPSLPAAFKGAACGEDAERFARACFEDAGFLLASAHAASQSSLKAELMAAAQVDIGGRYSAGVCSRCHKQILPLWAECHSHWGTTCDRDNSCQCPPDALASDDEQDAGEPDPHAKRRKTTVPLARHAPDHSPAQKAGSKPAPKPAPKPKAQFIASSFF